MRRQVLCWALASAATALLAAPRAGAATFTKGPYLQSLGASAVTVKLELSESLQAKVEVLPLGSDKPVASRASDDARFFHALRLEGLTPGTTYEYRVTSAGTKPEGGRFTTAPAGNPPFRFLLYGDSRSDATAHAAVVRAMERAPSDLLINTGDMVYSGKDDRDWRTFFEIERGLLRDRCVFAAVGNHELSRGDPSGEIAFLRYFAAIEDGREVRRLYGSFRWSNTRFFLLNAMDNWTGEERDWLRAELDAALTEPGLLHRIAVLHHGPFSAGPHGGNPALANGAVVAMMRDRKVDLVFAGHDHAYERGDGDGLKYIVSGGSGAPLYPQQGKGRQTLAFESIHHFVEVAIDGDKVSTVARRASGSVIESCGFQGAGPWSCDDAKPAPGATSPLPAPGGTRAGSSSQGSGCGCAVPKGSDRPNAWGAAIALVLGLGARRGTRRKSRA